MAWWFLKNRKDNHINLCLKPFIRKGFLLIKYTDMVLYLYRSKQPKGLNHEQ